MTKLQRVRAAIVAGDYAKALAIIDGHERRGRPPKYDWNVPVRSGVMLHCTTESGARSLARRAGKARGWRFEAVFDDIHGWIAMRRE